MKLFLFILAFVLSTVSYTQTASFKAFSYASFTEADCYGCGIKAGTFSGAIIQIGTIKHALYNPIKAKYRGPFVDLEDAFGKKMSVKLSQISGFSVGTNISEFISAVNTIELSGMVTGQNWSEYPATQAVNIDGYDITGVNSISFSTDEMSIISSGGVVQANGVALITLPRLVDSLATKANTNQAVPSGGGTGNVLMKSSNTDYDLTWGVVAYPTAITELTGAQDSLDARARLVHTHVVSDVTGLQDSLNARANSLGVDDNYVTDAEKTKLSNLSGTNTGDQTNISGNAATVTTNANLTGIVTSVGNATNIANGAIGNALLTNGDVANLSGTNTGDNSVNSNYSGLVTNATHTGDATGSGVLTVVAVNGTNLAALGTGVVKNTTATGVPFISKVALTEPATSSTLTIADGQTLTVNGSATVTNGTHSGTNTGDQTSIAGITGTVAQFNTAITDGDLATGGGTATGTNTGDQDLSGKQDALVSATNIKTVNGTSILGAGNIAAIPTGGTATQVLAKINGTDYNVQWQNSPAPNFSAQNITLDNTTFANQFGVIQKSSNRFLHNFSYGNNGTVTPTGRNIHLGELAGNFTAGATATVVTQGSNNTAIGYEAQLSSTTGYANITLGNGSHRLLTTGYENIAIGFGSSAAALTGNNNVAIGKNTLAAGTTAANNFFGGDGAGRYITTGYDNVAIGRTALGAATATTSFENIAIGPQALGTGSSSQGNVAIGAISLRATTTGSNNTAVGRYTMYPCTTHAGGSAFGASAMGDLATGQDNTGIGSQSLQYITTGTGHTALGFGAGRYHNDGTTNNVGGVSTGNLYLGYNTTTQGNAQSNEIVIGQTAQGNGSNSITLGNANISKTFLRSGVHIGSVSTPTARLQIAAGTATASTAPLKFTSGTLNTTAEAGAVEFLTNDFYGTITTGAARKKFAMTETSGALRVPTTGGAAVAGVATMVDGVVTINTTAATATSVIIISRKTAGAVNGILTYTVSAGTSFTINSTGAVNDDAEIAWFIVEGY